MQRSFAASRLSVPLFSALLLVMLFVSACSSGGTSTAAKTVTPSPTPFPTPTVSVAMQNQGQTQLQVFQQWIDLMKQYKGNAGTYQRQYTSDQQALKNATTTDTYNHALQTLNTHANAIQLPAVKQETQNLQQTLQQEAAAWGQQHQYHDDYNGKTYGLAYEYDNVNGIGGPLWLQGDLAADKTVADYQQTIENLHMWLTDFQAMKTDSSDSTPYSQPHQADMTLLKHNGFMSGPVIVVSLNEQALRAYVNGKLVNSFQVTTGQPNLPTPPGTWWIEGKQHPTVFKSNAPKNSPEWYPPTPIAYAMQYHSNGYFFHTADWRTQFGPGTNFPHQDPDGDPFAGQGSHGCINMSTANSQWLYGFVSVYTHVIIY
ncbi:MAG TPA: L,D-transpeptidase [Ktedonobacteraceae bacterium]|nr:L,D-transpeptidase [Ktedonobacteraceae bacterium]